MAGLERQSREGELLKGKYQLAERLGVGGMGEVYRARNLLVDRTVAIKVLHRDLAGDPHVIERFLREAKAANVVRHRNIADVLDIDTADDGVMFIVEEYLEGEDLLTKLEAEGGRLSPKETLDLLIPVADAVGAAHAKGLVHRDLKPDNVFLALVDDQIVPKVLDFGISKVPLQEQGPARPPSGSTPGLPGVRLTSVFGAIGTPAYMSPEQIKDPCSVDARTDVWALGVMLYEAISGDLPFLSDNLGSLFAEICTREPVPLERLAPEVTRELSRVVHRCLRPDAKQRFADAAELGRALNDVRRKMSEPAPEGLAVSSAPPGPIPGSSAAGPPGSRRPEAVAPPAASAPPAKNPFAPARAQPFGVPAKLELGVPEPQRRGPRLAAPIDWELEVPSPAAAKVHSVAPRSGRPMSRPAPGRSADARVDAFDLDDGISHVHASAPERSAVPASPPGRYSMPASPPGRSSVPASPPERSSVPASPPERSSVPASRSGRSSAPASGPIPGASPELELGAPARPHAQSLPLAIAGMVGTGVDPVVRSLRPESMGAPRMAPAGASAPPPSEQSRTPASVRSLPPAEGPSASGFHAASSSTHRRIMLSGIVPKVPPPTALELVRFALCCALAIAVGVLAPLLSPKGLLLAERSWAAQALVPFAAGAAVLVVSGLWVFVRAGRGPSVPLLFAGIGLWVLGTVSGLGAALLAAPGLISDSVRTIGLAAAPWAAMATLGAMSAQGALRARERRQAGATRSPMTVSLLVTAVGGLLLAAWVVLGPRATTEEISRFTLAPADERTTPKLRRFAVTALGARVILHEPPITAPARGAAMTEGSAASGAAPR